MRTCELPSPQVSTWLRGRIHSTGTLLAQLQLPRQHLVPVSSDWSPFFMVDPSSLLENGSHAWMMCEGAPGRIVIEITDFDPTHQYTELI